MTDTIYVTTHQPGGSITMDRADFYKLLDRISQTVDICILQEQDSEAKYSK